jgi:mannitol/fructose-specific phosphotransferase system IIA component
LTPAATRQRGLKFEREHLRHLSVCIATTGEERTELLRGVTPVHEEGEKTAVLTTDVAGHAMQMHLVIFPSGAVLI